MELVTIVSALIVSKHSWSVAAQFEDTYLGYESLEDRNASALDLISSTIGDLLDSELLADGYEQDALRRYQDRLKAHLMEN
jgi:hypothetical protein